MLKSGAKLNLRPVLRACGAPGQCGRAGPRVHRL